MALQFSIFMEIAIAFLIFFITRFSIRSIFFRKPRKLFPPGPKGWPLVGALPLLGAMPHVTLAEMAKKYGPVMFLNLGACNMVVASSPQAAKAFLKTLDMNFSNRAPNAGATHLAYDSQDLVFADYGPRWKLLRKLSSLHMLGGKAMEDWASIREVELGLMLKAMHESSSRGEAVVVPELLSFAIANMISQVIVSRRLFETVGSESNEFKDMVVELMTLAGFFNIGDCIPSMAWMDLQGIEGKMKKLHKRFEVLLAKTIEEHAASADKRKGKPDLLDMLMSNHENSDADGERLSMTNIKALLLNIFTAGTDTSSSIIEWSLAEMLKKPVTFKRAHEEMDRVIGRQRRLQESDIPNLPYLRAISKETFRKHPSTPLNLPRISTQACEVNGYYIPKNTRLSVNIWAIGRDPEVWENPLGFTPERFLSGKNEKIEPTGNDFELIPFGSGRRICAGSRMGIVLVDYILGTLIHSFDWKLSADVVDLNMDESFGLALQKSVPLSAFVSPRLPLSAYAC